MTNVPLSRAELDSASDSTIQRWSIRQSVVGSSTIHHVSSFTNCCIDDTLLDENWRFNRTSANLLSVNC